MRFLKGCSRAILSSSLLSTYHTTGRNPNTSIFSLHTAADNRKRRQQLTSFVKSSSNDSMNEGDEINEDGKKYPIDVIEYFRSSQHSSASSTTNTTTVPWDDRKLLQSQLTLQEKGWNVQVTWKDTQYGIGLFTEQDIKAGTILRVGKVGKNLLTFQSIHDINSFIYDQSNTNSEQEIQSRINYFKDYLWGFYAYNTDEKGYPIPNVATEEDRIYGMWIPGNGLNHNTQPNTVYKYMNGNIVLVALEDLHIGQELYDDYRRHGYAPNWLLEWGTQNNVTLNFIGCNDFVIE